MVVGLEEVVGRQTRLDAQAEVDHPLPLRCDHFVEQTLDLVGRVPADTASFPRARAPRDGGARPDRADRSRRDPVPPASLAA